MKEMDFDKYKAAWKSERGFEKNTLSESEIKGFLKKRSKEIHRMFKKGLTFDIIFKSVIGASFIVLSIMFFPGMKVLYISSVLMAGIILSIIFQARMLKKIPSADYAVDNLRKVLECAIRFYKNKYIRSLYIAALSNALLIISGMLYYFYFKYGELRPFETDDYVVFGLVIIISFVLGAYMQIKLHNFHIGQLEQSLLEIDENVINELTIKRQNNKRRQLFFIFLLAVICGLLILAFFLTRT
jgi:hypothetical protein